MVIVACLLFTSLLYPMRVRTPLRGETPTSAAGLIVLACVLFAGAGVRGDASAAPTTKESDGKTSPAGSASRDTPKPASVAVERHHGVPTFFIDGKPHPGTMATYYASPPEYIRLFSEAGVNLFDFTNTASAPFWETFGGQSWSAPDTFDYSSFDQMVADVLSVNPAAHFLPRLALRAPDWWLEAHPDEMATYEAADGSHPPMPPADYAKSLQDAGFGLNPSMVKPMPSWASEVWRQDTCKALAALIHHIDQSTYADRVIGFHLASGESQEWFMWQSSRGLTTDFSRPNRNRFRQWLRERYASDGALQKAWVQPTVTRATAEIPPLSVRNKTAFGTLRDPAKEQWVIDYLTYNSWLVADTIDCLAKGVKTASGGQKLAGAAYGYVVGLAGEPRQQLSGHHDLDRLLRSPNIDFLYSPALYWEFRDLRTGTPATMSLLGSAYLHGKAWVNETDFHTSITSGKAPFGEGDTIDDDVLQQRRVQGWVLANGLRQGWFNVGGINYDDPRLRKEIAKQTDLALRAQDLDRTPVDKVAFIVDPKSVFLHAIGDLMGRELLMMQLPALVRFGGASGYYALADLDRIRDHKVFIFANVMAPTEEERKSIDALKRDGNTLVFIYAAGLYRDGKIDAAAMQAMTGIGIKQDTPAANLHVTITTDDPAFAALNGIGYGTMRKVDPFFVPDDADAKVIGRLDDGRPGLVVKRRKGWTSVFSAAPLLPAGLFRALAEAADVHLFAEAGDALWATRDLLTISAEKGGKRDIRLPEKRHVFDAYEEKELGVTDRFSVDIAPKDTRVFFLGRR